MYKGTFSTILLLYFSFVNWKQGITGWTTLSSPGAPLVVMATTCGATGGIWGRWLCGLRFFFVFSARLIWHLHPIYRDNHVTEMQTMLCILVLLCFNFFFFFLLSHKLSFEYESRDRHFDDFGVAGGTMSCHYDNLRCHRWRRACRSDGPLFSMLDVPVLNALFMF